MSLTLGLCDVATDLFTLKWAARREGAGAGSARAVRWQTDRFGCAGAAPVAAAPSARMEAETVARQRRGETGCGNASVGNTSDRWLRSRVRAGLGRGDGAPRRRARGDDGGGARARDGAREKLFDLLVQMHVRVLAPGVIVEEKAGPRRRDGGDEGDQRRSRQGSESAGGVHRANAGLAQASHRVMVGRSPQRHRRSPG